MKHRRKLAIVLSALLLLQPFFTISLAPFANIAFAEEEEEIEKPRPGVNNADDHRYRVSPGNSFPLPGSGPFPIIDHPPSSGGGGDNGGGTILDPTDPTTNLDPSRPNRGNGDRYAGGEDKADGGGEERGSDHTSGNSSGDSEGDGNRNGGSSDSARHDTNENSGGNNDSRDSASNDDDKNSSDNNSSSGESAGENGERSGEGGNSDLAGNRGDSSGNEGESKDPVDVIKENLKEGKDAVTIIELLNKLENGESINSGDVLFLLSLLNISDDEDVQKVYETIISQASSARSLGNEIKDTHAIRYGDRGKLNFKDWFKFNTYKDAFITHTKDFLSDEAYRILFGEEKSALVKNSDSNKIKLAQPLQWIGDQLSSGLQAIGSVVGRAGSALISGIDRGIQTLGNGLSSIANGTQSLISKGIDGIKGLQHRVTSALGEAKSFASRALLHAVDGIIGATSRGLSALGNVASKASQLGQAIANSSVGKAASSIWSNVKNFGSSVWQSGKNIASTVANSKVGQIIKGVIHSPLGKVGSVALSGLSIWSGVVDLSGDGPWYKKVSGGLSITSGALGIAAVFAAGTAAAPLLVGGAFVAGVGALAFTYGPKLINKWNESRFGQAVNNAVRNTVNAAIDTGRRIGNAIADTASNVFNSISSGISSLFGR